MARVNIEEQFYSQSRKRRLARLLGYPEQIVIGLLAYLWHDSQDYEQITATQDEIVEWCRLDELQDWESDISNKVQTTDEVLISALIKSRFISEISPNCYKIHGNEGQIREITKWREKGKKAAQARWQRVSGKSDAPVHAQCMPYISIQDNTIHNNSSQHNSIQDNSKEEESPQIKISRAPDLRELWNDHCEKLRPLNRMSKAREEHWRNRWRENPDIEYWVSVIKRIANSPFCQGNNDRGWVGNVDFLLRASTHIKVMEGHYDGVPINRKLTYAESTEAHLKNMYERVEAGEL